MCRIHLREIALKDIDVRSPEFFLKMFCYFCRGNSHFWEKSVKKNFTQAPHFAPPILIFFTGHPMFDGLLLNLISLEGTTARLSTILD